MPTANVASKDSLSIKKAAAGGAGPSDYISEAERFELLARICDELNKEPEFTRVRFEPSDIEFKNKDKGTSTIHTLRTLKTLHPSYRLVLAMGEDNGNQLAWWTDIAEYPGLIDRMLFIDRKLSKVESDAAKASMPASPFPFASTYPGAEQTHMRFGTSWDKTHPLFPEILASHPAIANALAELAGKTDLLEPPLAKEPAVSSTGLRAALRSGDEGEAMRIAGALYPIIKDKRLLTRSKGEVAGMIGAGALARRNTRRRRSNRRSNRRRNTRQRR